MFVTRLISGIVLIIIALLALGLGGPVLAAVLLAISLIAYRELTKVLQVADKEEWQEWESIMLLFIFQVRKYCN